jgi:hypothetical protein
MLEAQSGEGLGERHENIGGVVAMVRQGAFDALEDDKGNGLAEKADHRGLLLNRWTST